MSSVVISSVAEVRDHLSRVRSSGRRVGVVPTMGALHEGHLSLVREAARRTDEVVVTIFVNPTQFGPGEDFDRYPRMLEADVAAVTSAGARVVFAPPVFEMYPPGEQTRVRVTGLSQGLCGVSRPHHFEGVATIVTKLMNVVGPGVYFFGQKDYQQWKLIEQMARDLLLDVEVVGLPIVRDDDGLAMSSRNAYLSPDERKKALSLSRGLRRAEELFDSGVRSTTDLVDAVRAELSAAGVQGEYIELRGARDLSPVTSDADAPPPPWVIALATTIGKTRLIDNRVLGGESRSLGEWPFGGGGP